MTASLTTTRLSAPKPAETDAYAALSADMRALADRLDVVCVAFDQGVFSSRPTANAAHKGWYYLATDQGRTGIGVIYYCNGTSWVIPEPWTRDITDVVTPGFGPVNEDEVNFQFTATVAQSWRLQYLASRTVRKWNPIGAAALVGEVPSATPGVGTTALLSAIVRAPAPGRYHIDLHSGVEGTLNSRVGFFLSATGMSYTTPTVATAGTGIRVPLACAADFICSAATDVSLSAIVTGAAVTIVNAVVMLTPLELGT